MVAATCCFYEAFGDISVPRRFLRRVAPFGHLICMSTDETIDVDGPRAAAAILSRLPREARSRLVESIRTLNPQSALKIESIIVQSLAPSATRGKDRSASESSSNVLQSLTALPNAKLQEVLRQVSPRDLAVSLSHAPRQTQTKLVANISATKQQAVLDELQDLKSLTPRDVEAARAQLLKNVDGAYAAEAPADPPPTRRLRSRLA